MWPGDGGHVNPQGPPLHEEDRFELLPLRSPTPLVDTRTTPLANVITARYLTQGTGSLFVDSSCVLTNYVFTWFPPFAHSVLQYQSSPQMPLEPRNAPRRAYQRMYRRTQQPYRLLSLSERMHRFRPIQPSLQEEAREQRTNIDIPELPSRQTAKRSRRIHSTNPQGSIMQRVHPNETAELQIIPSDVWERNPERFSSWPEEPQIIITSDVQLQTDDNELTYEVNNVSFSASPIFSSTRRNSGSLRRRSSNATTVYTQETVPSYSLSTVPQYFSSIETSTDNLVADIATQVPSVHDENSSQSSLDSEDMESLESANIQYSDSETTSVIPYKVYPRIIPMPTLPGATIEAKQVANRVIKHARNNKTLNEKELHCLNCDLFPIQPVTGQCGHTRCLRCIQNTGACPCGVEASKTLHINTVIQYLICKMLPNDITRRNAVIPGSRSETLSEAASTALAVKPDSEMDGISLRPPRWTRSNRGHLLPARVRNSMPDLTERMPMSPQVQFEHARQLLSIGRYRDAAPHFARVAASSEALARSARTFLAQIIVVLAEGRDPRRIARDLFRSVRLQAASSWLKSSDLECVLCYHTYTKPVTTPCGHTYCRTCIERALDYRKVCALCSRPLENFELTATKDTVFVRAALDAIDASKPSLPLDPDVIPIFVCTVAYPSIPCPLFIFDPRYWLMIRRVLESGSRKFGMVAYERDRNYSDYGTVLEVCDCVHLEDGRSFLSTIGVSRFRVIERDVQDGCDVARIQPLTDISPTEDIVIIDLRLMGSQILYKALMWLNSMNKSVRAEIETAFGKIPRFEPGQEAWWETPDGPAWLWWLIAILPLRSEIKVLILSTKNLLKRMMAVSRTLEAIDQVAITTTSTSECEIRSALTNAAEWLERGS